MPLEFCPFCSSKLDSDTRTAELRFICKPCNKKFPSKPEDSLRIEISYGGSEETGGKYGVLEENAPYDPAGKKVMKECPKCSMPYLTHIYVGEKMISKYVCECGYKVLSKNWGEKGKLAKKSIAPT